MGKTDHLFIVGAGFSHNAGLPLTSSFTQELLNVTKLAGEGPSALTVEFLLRFVADTFNDKASAADFWPELEDIFTCVDLSANTGHHLGSNYSPSILRTVRRALIVRTIRMLRQAYTRQKKIGGESWQNLHQFFTDIRPSSTAFLSMNWDTVIEEGIETTQRISNFDYRCEAIPAKFSSSKIDLVDPLGRKLQVLKPHGSANWLYCDTCRKLFWLPANQTLRIANHLFKDADWKIVFDSIKKSYLSKSKSRACPKCRSDSLGTRFATFSYRKALDFPMHTRSWLAAEDLLREAKTWTFIGYSLPGADYEFKLLLKRVQLSRRREPRICLVTGGTDRTLENYKKFFGARFEAGHTAFSHGLDDAALNGLRALGVLR